MVERIVDGSVGRREARKLDRRQAIINAARTSFLVDGYAATSMSGLLKALGGSKATLWSYFRSKEELFAAVIADVTLAFRDLLTTDLRDADDLHATLSTFSRRFMQKLSEPDAIATWRLVVGETGRFPEVGRIFHEQAAKHVESALSNYLTVQVERGVLHDVDPVKMAQFLIALSAGQQNRSLWGVATPEPGKIDADASDFADYFLQLFATVKPPHGHHR